MDLFKFAINADDLGTLYRVEKVESATTFEKGSLVARGGHYTPQAIIDNAPALLKNHFDWHCKKPSPFISLFRDQRHARKWAQALIRKNHGMVCSLYKINPTHLTEDSISDASQPVRRFLVNLPSSARSQADGEYLVLHRIPAGAIEWLEELRDPSSTPPRNSGLQQACRSSAATPALRINSEHSMLDDYASRNLQSGNNLLAISPSPPLPTTAEPGAMIDDYVNLNSRSAGRSPADSPSPLSPTTAEPRALQPEWDSLTHGERDDKYALQDMRTDRLIKKITELANEELERGGQAPEARGQAIERLLKGVTENLRGPAGRWQQVGVAASLFGMEQV